MSCTGAVVPPRQAVSHHDYLTHLSQMHDVTGFAATSLNALHEVDWKNLKPVQFQAGPPSPLTTSDNIVAGPTIGRFGPTTFSPSDPQYLMGIGLMAAYGLGFFIITLLSCFCFCVCRGCGCCGCSGDPAPEGYTAKERYGVLLAMAVLVLISMIFSALGYANNNRVSQAISGSSGISAGANDLIVNVIAWLTSISKLLAGVGSTVDTVVPLVWALARTSSRDSSLPVCPSPFWKSDA